MDAGSASASSTATIATGPAGVSGPPPVSRSGIIDAVARLVVRRGPAAMQFAAIASEVGPAAQVQDWYPDMLALVDECYSRTAQGLQESLLVGETTPGTALDQLAAFLVTALDIRRERGSFLSFRASDELPERQRRRVRERELMILTRLKRILLKGQRDNSLALRHVDSACAMILACLEVPATAGDGAEQRMWDGEMIELLLAALAEPHGSESVPPREVAVARGSCRCGGVQYEIDGPFEVMAHCACAACRLQRGAGSANQVPVPQARFRWRSGQGQVTAYEAGPQQSRSFCSVCGSPVPRLDHSGQTLLCPAENLQQALGLRASSHVSIR